MVLIGPWRFEALWLAVSIALYVALAGIGFGLFTPTLSRQIRVLESDGPDSPLFTQLGRRNRIYGAILAVIVIAIIVLMVLKPGA